MISGFGCEEYRNCALLGYYAGSGRNSLPTFRDNPPEPPSRVTYRPQLQRPTTEGGADRLPLKVVPISCPETSVKNYCYLLRNNPKEHGSLLLQLDRVRITSDFYVIYPFDLKIYLNYI